MPEGVMIHKRFGNPHIKLYNNELQRLFAFKSLPNPNNSEEQVKTMTTPSFFSRVGFFGDEKSSNGNNESRNGDENNVDDQEDD